MSGRRSTETPIVGVIAVTVEAAPQGLVRFTLDPEGEDRVWSTMLLAHDDAVIGTATSPVRTAELLVRGSIDCIRQSLPSLEVGGLTMRPEPGPNNNAQIVAAGEARFLASEWESVRRTGGGA
ncbi:hypothetical protein [Streptomyces sp. AC495_CC817]|uniref:hypothetical protein n=1 Tax=Streptomyces sp. AC495_CC817 TaxID=2823900 RepID=UPI001C26FF9A|nr:hypothetical protein [Streptomyces sp. AC495_CC817]